MAAVLSFFIPGLGQLVQGRLFTAVLFFFLTLCGYIFFIIPGIICHLFVIIDAANYSRQTLLRDISRANERRA